MANKNQTDSISEELEKKRHEFQDEIAHNKPSKKRGSKKVSRKKLILGIILLGFLLVSLAGAAVYALWFSPERAVNDAIVRALTSQSLTFSGTMQSGKTLDVQFSGAVAGRDGARLTFNARVDINDKTDRLGSDVVLDKDGNLYMSAGGIRNALGNELVEDAANQGTYANLLLQKLEGKWLKISSTELQPYSRKIANIQSCLETVLKKNQGDEPLFSEAAQIYQKHRFIVVNKVLGTRGTSTGYGVYLDSDKLESFLGEFKSTVLYRQLQDCDSATFDLNPAAFVKKLSNQTKTIELWINPQHEITDIYTTGSLNGLQTDTRITPEFNQEAKIIVPSSTVSLTQLHQYLIDGTQALSLQKRSDATSKQVLEALKAKLQAAQ